MSAAEILRVLRMLSAMRAAAGQPFRASCIKAVATQIEELTPGEKAMVGLGSAT